MTQKHDHLEDGATGEQVPRLSWSATSHGWLATIPDGVGIFVSEDLYDKCLREYMSRQGRELKSFHEIMRAAEQEWQHQCDLVRTFQENLEQWLTSPDRGVRLTPRCPHDEHSSLVR